MGEQSTTPLLVATPMGSVEGVDRLISARCYVENMKHMNVRALGYTSCWQCFEARGCGWTVTLGHSLWRA
eukprot:2254848-Rhodomonas_salina.2